MVPLLSPWAGTPELSGWPTDCRCEKCPQMYKVQKATDSDWCMTRCSAGQEGIYLFRSHSFHPKHSFPAEEGKRDARVPLYCRWTLQLDWSHDSTHQHLLNSTIKPQKAVVKSLRLQTMFNNWSYFRLARGERWDLFNISPIQLNEDKVVSSEKEVKISQMCPFSDLNNVQFESRSQIVLINFTPIQIIWPPYIYIMVVPTTIEDPILFLSEPLGLPWRVKKVVKQLPNRTNSN